MKERSANLVPFRMFGIPEQDFEKSKVAFLFVPYDATTTWKPGSREGPKAILDASMCIDEIWGEEEWHPIVEDKFLYTFEGQVSKYGGSTREHLTSFRNFIWENIGKYGKIPFLIGGEHSLSYPNICAVYNNCNDFSILHFDAHPDLRDSYDGDYYSHSTPMRRSFELGHKVSLTSVGIRSIDRDVQRYIANQRKYNNQEKSLNIFGPRGFNLREVEYTLKENVYITVDLDVLDSMSAVGTPQPDGMNSEEVAQLLQYVITRHNIIGMDVVELSPVANLNAPNALAAKLIWKMVESLYFSMQKEERDGKNKTR